jgi:hypothetical protein
VIPLRREPRLAVIVVADIKIPPAVAQGHIIGDLVFPVKLHSSVPHVVEEIAATCRIKGAVGNCKRPILVAADIHTGFVIFPQLVKPPMASRASTKREHVGHAVSDPRGAMRRGFRKKKWLAITANEAPTRGIRLEVLERRNVRPISKIETYHASWGAFLRLWLWPRHPRL